ncbi:MAG: serpin family protein [Halanaerobiales bacterium]
MGFRRLCYFIITIMVVLLVLAGCNYNFSGLSEGSEEEYVVSEEEAQTLAELNNEFALSFYEHLPEEGNLVYSPYSVYTALSMLYAGTGTETRDIVGEKLGSYEFDTDDDFYSANGALRGELMDLNGENYEVNVGNSFWGDQTYEDDFQEDYFDLLEKYFSARVDVLDLKSDSEKSRQIINDWIEDQTNDLIQEMLKKGQIDDLSVFYLVNAVYFLGPWEEEFDKKKTEETEFNLADDSTEEVSMMKAKRNYPYYDARGGEDGKDYKALEIPYKDERAKMLFVMPTGDNSLTNLEEELDREELEFIRNNLEKVYDEESFEDEEHKPGIPVHIPKFEIETDINLNSSFIDYDLGMLYDFEESDFSGIIKGSQNNFAVSDALHSAVIKVDEEGTEAAGATVIEMIETAEPPQFIADRPFLYFVIEEESEAIIFMGRYTGPEN